MNKETMNITITNPLEFEKIIKELKESVIRMSDCFNNENTFMKKIDKTDIWTGEVQDKVYSKYLELSNCYNPVIESLKTYIKFLENTLNSYMNAELTINKDIEDNLEDLNVN